MLVQEEFEFGRRLKEIRLSRGMTQNDVGAAIGVSFNVISNWENGFGMPRLALFRDLCIALNCAPGDLLGLNPSGMTAEEYALLQGFRCLDDAGRHTMMAVLESQLAVRTDPAIEE